MSNRNVGGYLIQAYALRYPSEVHALIIADGLQACSEATAAIRARIPALPKEMQDAIYKAEAAEDFEDPSYKAAVQVNMAKFEKEPHCAILIFLGIVQSPCLSSWPCPPEDVKYALDVWSSQTTVYSERRHSAIWKLLLTISLQTLVGSAMILSLIRNTDRTLEWLDLPLSMSSRTLHTCRT